MEWCSSLKESYKKVTRIIDRTVVLCTFTNHQSRSFVIHISAQTLQFKKGTFSRPFQVRHKSLSSSCVSSISSCTVGWNIRDYIPKPLGGMVRHMKRTCHVDLHRDISYPKHLVHSIKDDRLNRKRDDRLNGKRSQAFILIPMEQLISWGVLSEPSRSED